MKIDVTPNPIDNFISNFNHFLERIVSKKKYGGIGLISEKVEVL